MSVEKPRPRLSPELKSLVHWSVSCFGQVVRRHLGEKSFGAIENLRSKMAQLRDSTADETIIVLRRELDALTKLSRTERRDFALAFALMLETINVCENAYRTHRLLLAAPAKASSLASASSLAAEASKKSAGEKSSAHLSALTYVLTAHPTEARAPANIAAFHELQNEFVQILKSTPNGQAITPTNSHEEKVRHALEIAWQTPLVRERQPRVKDEAENIYTNVLRDEALNTLLDLKSDGVPLSLRTWVGGDKDGHPGVDEKTMLESLTLSRTRLLEVARHLLKETHATLALVHNRPLETKLTGLEKKLAVLKSLKAGDAKRVDQAFRAADEFYKAYVKAFGSLHPSLRRLAELHSLFPALVVPLELRESSDVLMSGSAKDNKLAIVRMLRTLEKLSRGYSPLDYARGLIISMTEKLEHLQQAARFQKDIFGGSVPLPVIPLFEEESSLADSPQLVQAMIEDRVIGPSARQLWNEQLEVMVGYSDSSKEAGVLASRLAISRALPQLEAIIQSAGLTPVFFHGSGGSVDRGGGSIEDQTAWWPRSALNRYKVTIQGEMVERSFSTRAIAISQIMHIVASANAGLKTTAVIAQPKGLQDFGAAASKHYRERIANPEFLSLVEHATPYTYLSALKIGSRPLKRSTTLKVSGLRAIPWILCWTQTRILFPTWWGTGSAWSEMSDPQKLEIKTAFKNVPVFASYIKALGFTLAKIELPLWQLAIERSDLEKNLKATFIDDFKAELERTKKFFYEVTGQNEFLWFKPWLADSIHLRSAMIHPLNLLQLIAERDRDNHLLRLTVTGISSGMMTTG